MLTRIALCLLFGLSLGGCGSIPETDTVKRIYQFDWPREGIKATFQYETLQLADQKPVCAGKVSVENYGSKNYVLLIFKVSVYSSSKELIATDRFSLSGTFNPGYRAEIPVDTYNPLDHAIITKTYDKCPDDMNSANVKIDAF